MLLSIILLFVIQSQTCQSLVTGGPNCLIQSEMYAYEYLYANHLIYKDKYELRQTILKPLVRVDDYDRIRWAIKPADRTLNTFYIQNQKYKDYLCIHISAHSVFGELILYRTANGDHWSPKCQWRFEKVDKNRNSSVIIWNRPFKHKYLTAGWSFRVLNWRPSYNRTVYLADKPILASNLKKMKWKVNCDEGEFQWA
jgi:hypothetical protein